MTDAQVLNKDRGRGRFREAKRLVQNDGEVPSPEGRRMGEGEREGGKGDCT